MCIYLVLTCITTGLCSVVFPPLNSDWNSVSRAVFNYTHWTVVWTVLFVYSIQVSMFAVFFGQLFKKSKKTSLMLLIWIQK